MTEEPKRKPIRVLIADDQPLMREGLRLMLDLQPDLEVVGEAGTGEEAVRIASQIPVDVVLMDVQMPVMDGVQATREIKRRSSDVQVIILTTFDDDEYVFEGLRAGAAGYLLKDVSSSRLAEATRAAARGESFLQPSVAAKVVAEFARLSGREPRRAAANAQLAEPLSGRELQVLEHLSGGKTNREIAESVHLSEGTVKNYVTSILGKLGARDRTQAALKARELGLL